MVDLNIFIFVAVILAFSLVGSALLIDFVLGRKREEEIKGDLEIVGMRVARTRPKRDLVIWIFMLLLGLVFFCIGNAAKIYYQNKTRGWEEVFAEVGHSNKDAGMFTEVNYSYLGITYEDVPLNNADPTMREGQRITILVDPEHPDKVSVNMRTLTRPVANLAPVGATVSLLAGFLCAMEWTGKLGAQLAGEASLQLSDAEKERKRHNKTRTTFCSISAVVFISIYSMMPSPLLILAVVCLIIYPYYIKKAESRHREDKF